MAERNRKLEERKKMLGDSFVVNEDGSICLNPDFDKFRPAEKAIERFENGPKGVDDASTGERDMCC